MKRVILFSVMIFLWDCSRKSSPTPEKVTALPKEVTNTKDKCSDLDTLLAHSWRLADAPHAAHFRFYERNDSLVNLYLMGEYKPCLISLPRKAIEKKLGTPTFSDSNNIYYEFLSTDKSRPLCLKFWVVSDSVRSIRYQLCEGY